MCSGAVKCQDKEVAGNAPNEKSESSWVSWNKKARLILCVGADGGWESQGVR
jgi:hypothetical protein